MTRFRYGTQGVRGYTTGMRDLPNDGPSLLGDEDSAPFEVINREGGAHILLVCDHASNVVPHQLGHLGLDPETFEHHIGYANDGIPVPGNQNLDEPAKRQRIRDIFEPYHDAVNRALARLWNRAAAPAILSVHSFSPRFGDKPRPWDIGVLWNRDPRIAIPLMEHLERYDLRVGDNEPYSGHDLAYTIDVHGAAAGIANVAIEINQDQLGTPGEILKWVDILSESILPILDIPGLHRVERF